MGSMSYEPAGDYPVFDLGGTPNTRDLMIDLDPREGEDREIEEEWFNELAMMVLKEQLCYD